MNAHDIIDGYKGIMQLDLCGIDPSNRKILIEQHKKDIITYVEEQDKLPIRLRYENTTGRILKQLHKEEYIIDNQYQQKLLKQQQIDSKYYDRQMKYLNS